MHNKIEQGVAITRRNRTDPPCSVSRLTAHAPDGRPARPPAAFTDDDDDRHQWPLPVTASEVTSLWRYRNLCIIIIIIIISLASLHELPCVGGPVGLIM